VLFNSTKTFNERTPQDEWQHLNIQITNPRVQINFEIKRSNNLNWEETVYVTGATISMVKSHLVGLIFPWIHLQWNVKRSS
jgi:hypothetical protein